MLVFVLSIVPMIAISVVYFVTDKSSRPIVRLFSSAHGLLGAVLFCGAIIVWQAGGASRSLELPYFRLFVLPIASIVLSFFLHRGNKQVHLLQILNLLCMFGALFFGGMAIGADWP